LVQRLAVQIHAQRLREADRPVLVAHRYAVGAVPDDIAHAGAVYRAAQEEAPAAECRVPAAEADQAPGEVPELPIGIRPAEPGSLVVLAVRVVVAALGAPDLVAREQHRNALRQQQRREEVALLARPQRVDCRVPGRPLGAAVPGTVVALAVAVVLAVRVVV